MEEAKEAKTFEMTRDCHPFARHPYSMMRNKIIFSFACIYIICNSIYEYLRSLMGQTESVYNNNNNRSECF